MKSYSVLERILFPRTRLSEMKLKEALSGKTVLITGASSGIGEQLAYLAGRCGGSLILTARREEKLLAVKRSIEEEAEKAKVSIFSADLRDAAQLEALHAFIRELPNQPDIVVSNAGLSIRRAIFDSLDRAHDFDRTIAINYTAPLRLLLGLIPGLRSNGGQIINISTINMSLIPFPHWSAYQASKSAFDTWFRSAAPELNAAGIATTSVYLPLVRTPMIAPTKAYESSPAMSAEHAAQLIARAIYTRQRRIRPWWLPFGELASLWGRGAWERAAPLLLRRRERR
jgi:short-subunit dehydrogenase